jgi:Predicted exporters of the RND superfamily
MNLIDKLAERVKQATGSLARHVTKRSLAYTIGFILLTGIAILFVTKLELKSDFVDLLPQNFQSVIDLRKAAAKVGGLGYLSIGIESSDVKASERFADDIAAVLNREFNDRILYCDYKIDEAKKYYTDNAALFMDYDDLLEIQDRLDRRIRAEKKKANPLFLDLSGEIEQDSKLEFKDIEDKYEKDKGHAAKYIDNYYTGEDGHLLAMLIKPQGTFHDISASKKLLEDIMAAINKLDPTHYAPDMKYGFAGGFKSSVEEFETLKSDIFGTALLCISLVVLAVFLYFRRVRAVVFLGISCLASVMWTFAITYFTIGYLNTVTAFLGAIIVGTGINYGIIMLARYFEERRLGQSAEAALEIAMKNTVAATFGAAGTTAVAFGIFLTADVRSLSQFGFIGGIGVILIWIGAYTLLPALIMLSEKIWPSVEASAKHTPLWNDKVNLTFLTWPLRFPKLMVALFTVGAIASIVIFARYLPTSLEYNISNLRTKSSLESGTAVLDNRISRLFDTSMTPAIILADSVDEGADICRVLLQAKKQNGDSSGIENCRSILSLLPKQQDEKLPVIKDIQRLINDKALDIIEGDERKKIDDLKKKLPEKEVTLADLPKQLSRAFTDKDGNLGTFVFVYPRAGRDIWNATNLKRFTNDIRRIQLDNGKIISSSGDSVIFDDLLDLLKRDSPVTTVASFLGVFALVLIVFGSLRSSIFVAAPMVIGSLWMVGLMALFGTKINFFNFVALPITFGIGVDYSINIYQRYLQEGPGSINRVLRRTGIAVFLCSLTTMIGYFTLIIADSMALVSLGKLAILGEFTCLSAAMIFLPALIIMMEEKSKKQS